MATQHLFEAVLTWTGASSGPTKSYETYSREYTVEMPNKPPLRGSAAAVYRGDAALHNPEDLLLAAVSGCHLLTYLALCVKHGIQVVSYHDSCTAILALKDGKMRIISATLRPRVVIIAAGDIAAATSKAQALHEQAHDACFIANSVNFPIAHEATISTDVTARSGLVTP